MEGSFDDAGGNAFTPLERFVMELFRTISPNGGSISALGRGENAAFRAARLHRHAAHSTSFDPVHWEDPETFDPDRYNSAPTSHEINERRVRRMGSPDARSTARPSRSRTAARRRSTTAASARSTASLTASRCRSATMPASRPSASAIAAAPASNSPSRSSRISCARFGRARSSSQSSTSPARSRFPLGRPR